jgi:uncharacterized protein (TIGR02271 family)
MAYEQNSRTLVATFNDYDTAEKAVRELESHGVSRGSVHVDSAASSGSSTATYEKDRQNEGGFMGWWNSLFGSDDDDAERNSYRGALEGGNAIVRATVPAEIAEASVDILNRCGAVDVDRLSRTDTARGDTFGTDRSSDRAMDHTDERGPIQVMEEELQVGKRAVRRGGVRIYSHVVTEPVEQEINLREEHVNVERRPVNREISPEEVGQLRDQTIEVTETAEEAVVGKRARVVEEVVVGKESTNRTETIRDNVRHTEVEVENLGRENPGGENDRIMGQEGLSTSGQTGFGQTALGQTGAQTGARSGVRATGLSPNPPSPSVMSGGGTTAGAGTLAGENTAGWNTSDLSTDYRKNFETTYGSDRDFDSMRPAYEYGSRYANDSRYKGKSWNDVERDLRTDYERQYPNSTWDEVKNAVRHGWDKVTGQR